MTGAFIVYCTAAFFTTLIVMRWAISDWGGMIVPFCAACIIGMVWPLSALWYCWNDCPITEEEYS